MTAVHPYRIGEIEPFGPRFGHLIAMMTQARRVTLESVKGLGAGDLDFLLDDDANSIGALLSHIAAIERWYQVFTFEEREMEGEVLEQSLAAIDLGEPARREIRGHELPYYLDALSSAREHTLNEFRKRDEDWLLRERPFSKGEKANNFYLWFHVFEDEINHRGQINLIKKRISRGGA